MTDKYIVIMQRSYNGHIAGVYSRAFKVVKETKTGYQFDPADYKIPGGGNPFYSNSKRSGIRSVAGSTSWREGRKDVKYYVEHDTVLCLSHDETLPKSVGVFLSRLKAYGDSVGQADYARQTAESKFAPEREAANKAHNDAIAAYKAKVDAEVADAVANRTAATMQLHKTIDEMANGLVWR
jgi:hypothetical protein